MRYDAYLGIAKIKSLEVAYMWWPTVNAVIEKLSKTNKDYIILKYYPNKSTLKQNTY